MEAKVTMTIGRKITRDRLQRGWKALILREMFQGTVTFIE
jgi:DNA-binding HxlR family transcriptional regulator